VAAKGNNPESYLIDRLWHNYLSILDKSSVPSRPNAWYRKHVEKYIAAYPRPCMAITIEIMNVSNYGRI